MSDAFTDCYNDDENKQSIKESLGIADELDIINDLLEKAQIYGLRDEVVYFALKYMKEDPTISITEALNYGYGEWVK